MLSLPTRRGPETGSLKTPVKTVDGYAWHLVFRKGVYKYFSDPQRRTMRRAIDESVRLDAHRRDRERG